MTDTNTSEAPAGRTLGGRYRLDRKLASGGMASVWQATDEILVRQVAVKILHPHLAADTSFVERFRREAVAAARLTHPSIVQIYDTCSDNGTEAIVMELVAGSTLRGVLDGRETHALEPVEVVAIGSSVAEALSCAHRAGIVHRDVKPGNILLSHNGRVLVTDFGIAKAGEDTGSDLTQPGTTLGTVRYLAPEQLDGGPIDARTDVYALGVVLYELLCGRPPFDGSTETAMALARLHRDPLRPRQVRAGIPRSLEGVVLRALARDAGQRYQTADDLRAALQAAGRDEHLDTDATVMTGPRGEQARRASRPGEPNTPPGGIPRFVERDRSGLVPTLAILAVAAIVVTAGILFSRTEAARELFGGEGDGLTIPQAPPVLATAQAFDPQGTGGENDDQAGRAIDGDPGTSWTTETYSTRRMGNLKEGVGLVVGLDRLAPVSQLVVRSSSEGWAAAVYVRPDSPADLAGWGEPVTAQEDVAGDATFDVGGIEGQYVLVWITDLGGAPYRMEITEVELAA